MFPNNTDFFHKEHALFMLPKTHITATEFKLKKMTLQILLKMID